MLHALGSNAYQVFVALAALSFSQAFSRHSRFSILCYLLLAVLIVGNAGCFITVNIVELVKNSTEALMYVSAFGRRRVYFKAADSKHFRFPVGLVLRNRLARNPRCRCLDGHTDP